MIQLLCWTLIFTLLNALLILSWYLRQNGELINYEFKTDQDHYYQFNPSVPDELSVKCPNSNGKKAILEIPALHGHFRLSIVHGKDLIPIKYTRALKFYCFDETNFFITLIPSLYSHCN